MAPTRAKHNSSTRQWREAREQRLSRELVLINERLEALATNDVDDSKTLTDGTETTFAASSLVSETRSQNDDDASTTFENRQVQDPLQNASARKNREKQTEYWMCEMERVERNLQRIREKYRGNSSTTTKPMPPKATLVSSSMSANTSEEPTVTKSKDVPTEENKTNKCDDNVDGNNKNGSELHETSPTTEPSDNVSISEHEIHADGPNRVYDQSKSAPRESRPVASASSRSDETTGNTTESPRVTAITLCSDEPDVVPTTPNKVTHGLVLEVEGDATEVHGMTSRKPAVVSFSDDVANSNSSSQVEPREDEDAFQPPLSDDGGPNKTRTLQEWCRLLRLDEVVKMPDETSPVLPPNIDDDALKDIARAVLRGRLGIVQKLEKLDLSGCNIGDEGVRQLLEEVRLSLFHNPKSFRRCRLKSINLSNNPITEKVKEELVDIVHTVGSITEFQVDNQTEETMRFINCCTTARLQVEREREERRRLKKMREEEKKKAGNVTETEVHAREAASSPHQENKTDVLPTRRQRRVSRARATRSSTFKAKQQLDLELSLLWSRANDRALTSVQQTMITDMNLSGRLIGDNGVESLITALRTSGGSKFLTSLFLDGNTISERGGKVIARYLSGQEQEVETGQVATNKDEKVKLQPPVLKYLQLDWNNIGINGAMAIGQAMSTNDELRELYLGRNRVGDKGAAAIAVALWGRREQGRSGGVVDLSLIGNDIGFIGVSTIAECLEPMAGSGHNEEERTISIERLRLGDNPKIGKENGGRCIDRLVNAIETNVTFTYLSLWRCGVSSHGEKQLTDLVSKRKRGLDGDESRGGITIYFDERSVEKTKEEAGTPVANLQGQDHSVALRSPDAETKNEFAKSTGATTGNETETELLRPETLSFRRLEWDDNEWGKGWYSGQVKRSGKPHGRGEFKTTGNEKVYEGQWESGSRTGWGEAEWLDGRKYRGYWRDGYFHGSGEYTHRGETKRYEGEFKNGERCGHGRQEYRNGSVYDGHWRNNMREGTGVLLSPKGRVVYDGNWMCNKQEQRKERKATRQRGYISQLTSAMATVRTLVRRRASSSFSQSGFEGMNREELEMKRKTLSQDELTAVADVDDMEWTDLQWGFGKYKGLVNAKRQPHGKGTFCSEEGHRYEGDFRIGERTGVGKATWASGSSYDGEWDGGRRHGKGQNVMGDGTRYTGCWRFNERHGDGEQTLKDGSKKYGEWKYDRFIKEKRRVHLDPSSDSSAEGGSFEDEVVALPHFDNMWGVGTYEGEIDDTGEKTVPCGEGEFKMGDGRWYDGQWENGRRHGQGTASWPVEGMEYDGEWKDGKRHGFGSAVWEDGTRFQGRWRENQRHGHGILILPNGEFWEGRWDHNERCLEE